MRKSISASPVITENKTAERDGKPVIEVDPKKCIGCGAWLFRFEKGSKISILLAPTFAANYPKECKQIQGDLKRLGVNRIISVSFGADITT